MAEQHASVSDARLPSRPGLFWATTRFRIDLSRPRVMGIVNVTPDSFSDGGVHGDARSAITTCERLLVDGADILDIGGESTRPGSSPIPVDEELARVVPVLRHVVTLGCPVSIDTTKAAVMQAALDLGADIVNDIRALRDEGALDVVAAHSGCGVCLMHMRGEPLSMQAAPAYDDVVDEVSAFLRARAQVLEARGVAADRIVIDPGIGFGKRIDDNLALLRRQRELLVLGYPVLAGWSRKRTLGALTRRAVGDRVAASVAAALGAVQQGARVVRVHDVSATVDALTVWHAAGLLPTADNPPASREPR